MKLKGKINIAGIYSFTEKHSFSKIRFPKIQV